MLAAALFGDRAEFQLLFDWTRHVLRRPTDALHAWRYRPGTAQPVDDPNNATDGDLLIGLALFTASDRWGAPEYRAAGLAIAADCLRLLVKRANGRQVLMPGYMGFEEGPDVFLNPSYYVFPALQRFSQELPNPAWQALWSDGVALLHEARFGRWNLPVDWITVPRGPGPVTPASKWPARFSFDAVRLPLYLCWGGLTAHPLVQSTLAFWSDHGGVSCPAWIDVKSGDLAPYGQTDGMKAIQAYVQTMANGGQHVADLPRIATTADYYSGALTLLVHAAQAMRPTALV